MINNYKYLGKNKTKFENILTHLSVAGSNDEKTRWTVPLKKMYSEQGKFVNIKENVSQCRGKYQHWGKYISGQVKTINIIENVFRAGEICKH